ncbi:hypothetical protein KQI84_06450 [bacterium]|nr:hypothetical protein [bacterium]
MKRFSSLFALALLILSSVAITGCGGGAGKFDITVANNSGQYVSDIIVEYGTQSTTFGLIPPGESQTQQIQIESAEKFYIDYLDADGNNWTETVDLQLEPRYLGKVAFNLEPDGKVRPMANINVRR